MKWHDLLAILGREPVFSASLLQTGEVSRAELSVQLSRWVKTGRLIQLRRGVYVIAQPFRQIEPHPFLVANTLRKNSYVSLQSSLAFHGLIPEYVPVCTSVTTGRSEQLETALGNFTDRRMNHDYFFGFRQQEVAPGQRAFIAVAEKALLDLVYLTPGGDTHSYLSELRLQHTETIDAKALEKLADRIGKPKLRSAVKIIHQLLEDEEMNSA
ncbi:MAG: type IV toxin-antitoxin system AbiEi family antitoxin domain-containing protein [Chitinivibrionia bacterium]|nr:type IV toxin-antitoxin system AbiEi family antitoxin domain-containing protein [Chitinivibrionia bacterium]